LGIDVLTFSIENKTEKVLETIYIMFLDNCSSF
jgi:hypothetical protein